MHRETDSVRIVIFHAEDPESFFVLTEVDDPTNWKLPGGKFEQDESPDEAANRELAEEVGVTGAQIGLCAAATLTNDDGVSARFIFVGTANPEDIRPSDEIDETKWFTADTLPECKHRQHILTAVAAARGLATTP